MYRTALIEDINLALVELATRYYQHCVDLDLKAGKGRAHHICTSANCHRSNHRAQMSSWSCKVVDGEKGRQE